MLSTTLSILSVVSSGPSTFADRSDRRPPPPATTCRAAADLPQLPFEKYTLPNGLEVILHEDHRMPEVAVNVWYNVGARDEAAGPHRLRPPVRAHDVPGVEARRRGQALRIPAEGGRLQRQRHDVAPTAPTTTRSSRRISSSSRSGSRATAWASCSTGVGFKETHRQPARRGQERAPPALREPAVWAWCRRCCSRRCIRRTTRTTTRSSARWRT